MPKYYSKPEFSRTEVNKAGATFVNPNATDAEKEHALEVINNWRVSHNFPLNTFQWRLRYVAKRINPDSLKKIGLYWLVRTDSPFLQEVD